MTSGQVSVTEAKCIILNRVLAQFGLSQPDGNRYGIDSIEGSVCSITITHSKFSIFGLFSIPWSTKCIKYLGAIDRYNDKIFDVNGRSNLPLAVMFIEKLSADLGYKIDVKLNHEKGEHVDFDEQTLLNNRRKLLEKEQRRIENELADVHKKLQAFEGGGGPYRALNAVE